MGVGVFFFQGEDGIRYSSVTGVQTCALPISIGALVYNLAAGMIGGIKFELEGVGPQYAPPPPPQQWSPNPYPEIGRASCRGKSVDLGGRRIIKKKKGTRQ